MEAERANVNHGSDAKLIVKSNAKTRRTYIKFDLNSIPSGKAITSAKLYLFVVSANPASNVQVNVNESGDSWSESTITWNNAPSVGAFVASTDVGGVNQSYFWDITSYAQTEYSGDKILSVVVKFSQDDPAQDNPNYERKFASKEDGNVSIRPYLEITYTTTPPVASFTFSPSYPIPNDTVTFNASASYDPDGSIVSYQWDFGDGNVTTVTNPTITHAFSTENNFTVTLTVTDNEGLTDSATDIVPVVDPATLRVSLPDGTVVGSNPDPWLNKGWVLNQTGTSWSFTVKVTETSNSHTSYDVHLIIALNDIAYNNLVGLSVNGTTVPKSAFRNGTPTPYDLWTWSSDVYPTMFNDTYVNMGTISPNGYKTVVVSANFSDPTDTKMHFDAYGKVTTGTPNSKGDTTHSPSSEDSTVLGQSLPAPQSPIADFSWSPTYPQANETVTFDASTSYDPDGGSIVSYKWDFGDGNITTTSNSTITHKFATFGDYNVNLTVTDDESQTGSKNQTVNVEQPPVASFTYSPSKPLVDEPVEFDASSSTPDGGTITGYKWDFDDGNVTTTPNPIITHVYTSLAEYNVTLTVFDSEGKADSTWQIVKVHSPPYANFTFTPDWPDMNEVVTFNATGSYDPDGTITTYYWDFGDNTTIVESDPITTHTYTGPGEFMVTLTVTDNDGFNSSTTAAVNVNPAILRVSLPDGTYFGADPDPWLNDGWLLNITGTSGTFTLRINSTSASITSNDTHLIIALNNASYSNLVSLSVNGTPISGFQYGTPKPYNVWNWPSGDVYPTWFNDSYIVGLIGPKDYVDLIINVTFSNVTGVRMHFDAYGRRDGAPPIGNITHNPISEDSTVLFSPAPVVQYYLTVETDPPGLIPAPTPPSQWYNESTNVNLTAPAYANVSTDTRYRFDHWTVDNVTYYTQNITVHTDANHTATAHYILQYRVCFDQTGLDGTANSTVVTVNGSPKNFSDLPFYMWVDNGSSVTYNYSAIVSSTVPGKRFSLVSVSGPSSPVIVTGPVTIIGNYKTQYKVTFDQSGVGTDFTGTVVTIDGTGYGVNDLSVSFWWDEGAIHNFTFQSPLVVTPNAKRYVWNSTSGLSSLQSDSITVSTSGSIIGNYKTQFYLNLATSPPSVTTPSGEGWYYNGTYASISTDELVPIVPGASRYSFSNWTTGDMSEIVNASSPSTTVLMDKAKTVTANYVTQYYLTVKTDPSGLSPQPSGEGWYDESTNVNLTAPDPSYLNSVAYNFTYWDVDGTSQGSGVNPIIVHMDTNHTATAHYQGPPPKYYLTVKTDPEGIDTIPGEGWYDNCTYVNLTAPQYIDVSPGVRYRFDYWDVDGANVSGNPITVHMDANHTATAHYVLQYYLTVATSPPGVDAPTGEGWYDNSAYAPISTAMYDDIVPGESRYKFNGWTTADMAEITNPTLPSTTVHMDKAKTVTANYVIEYIEQPVGGYAAPIDIAIGKEISHLLASQIGLAFALIAAMAATILLTKRRNKTLK